MMMDIAQQSIKASQDNIQVMTQLASALSGHRGPRALEDRTGGDAAPTVPMAWSAGFVRAAPELTEEDISALMTERLEHPTRRNAMIQFSPTMLPARFLPMQTATNITMGNPQ